MAFTNGPFTPPPFTSTGCAVVPGGVVSPPPPPPHAVISDNTNTIVMVFKLLNKSRKDVMNLSRFILTTLLNSKK